MVKADQEYKAYEVCQFIQDGYSTQRDVFVKNDLEYKIEDHKVQDFTPRIVMASADNRVSLL